MGVREIRNRIQSVKNIAQITKAMKMVAAARLRRAQARLLAAEPYSRGLERVLAGVLTGDDPPRHPLMQKGKEGGQILVLLVTSDRGLCANFNTNVLRRLGEVAGEAGGERLEILAVGKKGRDFLKRSPMKVVEERIGLSTKLDQSLALEVGAVLATRFLKGNLERVLLVGTRFETVARRQVVAQDLLPLEAPPVSEDKPEFRLYEPSPQEAVSELAPRVLNSRIWMALAGSVASEMAARMLAMEAASKNAVDMIDDLTLQGNRARQAAITKELSEIVGGAAALEG